MKNIKDCLNEAMGVRNAARVRAAGDIMPNKKYDIDAFLILKCIQTYAYGNKKTGDVYEKVLNKMKSVYDTCVELYDNYEKYYSKYDVDTYSIIVGATGMLSKSTGKTITRSEFLELVKEYDEELIELQNK